MGQMSSSHSNSDDQVLASGSLSSVTEPTYNCVYDCYGHWRCIMVPWRVSGGRELPRLILDIERESYTVIPDYGVDAAIVMKEYSSAWDLQVYEVRWHAQVAFPGDRITRGSHIALDHVSAIKFGNTLIDSGILNRDFTLGPRGQAEVRTLQHSLVATAERSTSSNTTPESSGRPVQLSPTPVPDHS
jgi:hypothetical protein